MNWLEINDQERLRLYACEICALTSASTLFASAEAESYFTDAASRRCNNIPDIMRYEPVTIRGIREKLLRLWQDADLPEKELLVTIVAAAMLKNEPYPLDYARRQYEWRLATKKEVDGAFIPQHMIKSDPSPANSPSDKDTLESVLVYEF